MFFSENISCKADLVQTYAPLATMGSDGVKGGGVDFFEAA
jgi:hypothetical protein